MVDLSGWSMDGETYMTRHTIEHMIDDVWSRGFRLLMMEGLVTRVDQWDGNGNPLFAVQGGIGQFKQDVAFLDSKFRLEELNHCETHKE